MNKNTHNKSLKNCNFLRLLLLLIGSIGIFPLLFLLSKKYKSYFCPPNERMAYQIMKHNDDTLRIAYIGDSWANGHKDHNCIIAELLEDSIHRPVKIESFGIGGLTSKEIYHALFEIEIFKNFISKGFDYCFISAGINDASKKMSTKYYTGSMDCIIKFFFANDITPIILEIPDYNIEKVFNNSKFWKKSIRYLCMMVNNTDIDCKRDYRNAMNKLVNEKYKNDVKIVHCNSWNKNYESDLKKIYKIDELHLNNSGYLLLDSAIFSTILRLHKH